MLYSRLVSDEAEEIPALEQLSAFYSCPVRVEDETGWMYRGPAIGLKEGWNIDADDGHFHFYMPFFEITGFSASWDNGKEK